ncbi:MAG: GNAT family N-acetyltransferase [Candidatus Lokiarchaeota archaeon]
MPLQVPSAVYRIETPRTVIRCYNPVDALLLEKSITQSLDHLKPWMTWVHDEPEPLSAKIHRLRRMRARFDLDEEYIYGIFTPEENFLIGGTGLHPRVGPKGIEIGYWINVNYINKGYCTEVVGALTKIAFEVLKFKRVEIHCDPMNLASA